MRVFRVALTGDFLDETGAVAYGDIGLTAWRASRTFTSTSWRISHQGQTTKATGHACTRWKLRRITSRTSMAWWSCVPG